MPLVSALHYYPVKSCRGISLEQADINEKGISGDRRYMIVDAKGEFITQRSHPKLALIKPELINKDLQLSAPGMGTISMGKPATTELREVRVWQDTVYVPDVGNKIADWLTAFLGFPAALVYMADSQKRYVSSTKVKPLRTEVGFADGFPFLLISRESLAELNGRLAHPVSMDRFRPNIVVEGCRAFEEDDWQKISIGEVTFSVVKPCARCVIVITDQTTLKKDKEPLRTLSSYRRDENGHVNFGQNCIHHSMGQISLGDEVRLIS